MLEIIDRILGSDTLLYFLICACSLMLCFFGYSMRKTWIIIFSFIFSVILLLLNPFNRILGSDIKILVVVVIIATICTFSISKQYMLGIFLLNFDISITTTLLLFICLSDGINNVPMISFMISLLITICAAILSIIQVKITTMFSTSICGGIVSGYLLSMIVPIANIPVGICIGVILSILGFYVQYKENHGLSDENASLSK